MSRQPALNANEVKVLASLASIDEDHYYPFAPISRDTKLNRAAVRRACRSLRRKGLARFRAGLWTEDGDPRGSGYGATLEGRERADRKLADKYVLRRWD